jgi:hypothetical protein
MLFRKHKRPRPPAVRRRPRRQRKLRLPARPLKLPLAAIQTHRGQPAIRCFAGALSRCSYRQTEAFEPFGLVGNVYSGPLLRVFHFDSGGGDTEIDATTGAIISQSYIDPTTGATLPLERPPHPGVEAVVKTVAVCPFDRSTAPWPHTGDPPGSTPQVLGRARYLEPDPASGIQVLIGGECANGCRNAVAVRSAYSEMQIDDKLESSGGRGV